MYSFLARAAVFDAPRTGRLKPTLKRFGFGFLTNERIVRVHVRGSWSDGSRNGGGKPDIGNDGRGGILQMSIVFGRYAIVSIRHLERCTFSEA